MASGHMADRQPQGREESFRIKNRVSEKVYLDSDQHLKEEDVGEKKQEESPN